MGINATSRFVNMRILLCIFCNVCFVVLQLSRCQFTLCLFISLFVEYVDKLLQEAMQLASIHNVARDKSLRDEVQMPKAPLPLTSQKVKPTLQDALARQQSRFNAIELLSDNLLGLPQWNFSKNWCTWISIISNVESSPELGYCHCQCIKHNVMMHGTPAWSLNIWWKYHTLYGL